MAGGVDGEEEKGGQVMMMMHGDEETDRYFVRRESKVFSASYGLMGWCIADSSPQRIAWHLLRGIQHTGHRNADRRLTNRKAQRDILLPYLLVLSSSHVPDAETPVLICCDASLPCALASGFQLYDPSFLPASPVLFPCWADLTRPI